MRTNHPELYSPVHKQLLLSLLHSRYVFVPAYRISCRPLTLSISKTYFVISPLSAQAGSLISNKGQKARRPRGQTDATSQLSLKFLSTLFLYPLLSHWVSQVTPKLPPCLWPPLPSICPELLLRNIDLITIIWNLLVGERIMQESYKVLASNYLSVFIFYTKPLFSNPNLSFFPLLIHIILYLFTALCTRDQMFLYTAPSHFSSCIFYISLSCTGSS